MKLHDYLIRAALAERNWSAAVDAVARHFAAPYIKSLPLTVMGMPQIVFNEIEVCTNRSHFGWTAPPGGFFEIPKNYIDPIHEEIRIWVAAP